MSNGVKPGLRSRLSRRLFLPHPWDFLFNPVYLIRRPMFVFLKRRAKDFEGSILDFGCGSMPYRHLFTSAEKYVGLDLEMPEHGLSRPDVQFDGNTIPFADESFDATVMFEVLDDLENPSQQLQEIRRVLRPDGRLLLSTSFVWELHEEPRDIARYTKYGLEQLLRTNGFVVETQSQEGNYTRVIGQMIAMYWYQTAQKVPLGLPLGLLIAGLTQFLTLIMEQVLPKRRELYLSNLTIARKAG